MAHILELSTTPDTADHSRLGKILQQNAFISDDDLSSALLQQKRYGGLLGDILSAAGKARQFDIAQVLASQWNYESFKNVLTEADALLSSPQELSNYLRFYCVPYRKRGKKVEILTAGINPEIIKWASSRYPRHTFIIGSRRDVLDTLTKLFGRELCERAVLDLWKQEPNISARYIAQNMDWNRLSVPICLFVLLVLSLPGITLSLLLGALNIVYAASICFKSLIFAAGAIRGNRGKAGHVQPCKGTSINSLMRAKCAKRASQKGKCTGKYMRFEKHSDKQICRRSRVNRDALQMEPKDYPIYTILIPLYKEREVVPCILNSIRRLDYPKHRLDVKLVVEATDHDTIEAIKENRPEDYFEIIRVPDSLPRTKPKACNYAIPFARGEFLTIYDAEDRPDRMQLKKALLRFRADENLTCLQGRLNYFNRNENLLTKLFAIEYSCWFDFMLKGIEAYGLPLPLGGTSNHIRMSHLRQNCGWDPFNVTEDAELGIRFISRGYKTQMLDSLTLEEAPNNLSIWIKQRSRWIKGYMQTYIVYMRSPRDLLQDIGWKGFLGFQLFIGGPSLVFLSTPVVWGIVLSLRLLGADSAINGLPPALQYVMWLNLFAGIIAHWLIAAYSASKNGWRRMHLSIFLFPLYWLLHSWASFIALWQLITRPHYWEKTKHGITRSNTTKRK